MIFSEATWRQRADNHGVETKGYVYELWCAIYISTWNYIILLILFHKILILKFYLKDSITLSEHV